MPRAIVSYFLLQPECQAPSPRRCRKQPAPQGSAWGPPANVIQDCFAPGQVSLRRRSKTEEQIRCRGPAPDAVAALKITETAGSSPPDNPCGLRRREENQCVCPAQNRCRILLKQSSCSGAICGCPLGRGIAGEEQAEARGQCDKHADTMFPRGCGNHRQDWTIAGGQLRGLLACAGKEAKEWIVVARGPGQRRWLGSLRLDCQSTAPAFADPIRSRKAVHVITTVDGIRAARR